MAATKGASIEFKPPDLPKRLAAYGFRADYEIRQAAPELAKGITIPAYPPASSPRYERTGRLASSLGTTMAGGSGGRPSIFQIRRLGQGSYEIVYGSSLDYARWVIGVRSQSRVMRGKGWWTMLVVMERSRAGLQKAIDTMSRRLLNFVEGAVWR
jgi:hypothetical protein